MNKDQKKKEKLIKLFKAGGKDSDLVIMEAIDELETKFEKTVDEIKKSTPNIDDVLKSIKGKDGENYTITDEDKKEISDIVLSEIPVPKNGEDGKDYVLTDEDKMEIAMGIDVPVVEKIIEKIEVTKEQPIVTQIVKEVAMTDIPEAIRNKLESLTGDSRLDISAIKGSEILTRIPDIERIAKENAFNPTMGPSFADLANINKRIDNLSSGGTPGGSPNSLQYNNAGVFGGFGAYYSTGSPSPYAGAYVDLFNNGLVYFDDHGYGLADGDFQVGGQMTANMYTVNGGTVIDSSENYTGNSYTLNNYNTTVIDNSANGFFTTVTGSNAITSQNGYYLGNFGQQIIDNSGNAYLNSVNSYNGYAVQGFGTIVDSTGNGQFSTLSISGGTVIDNSRNASFETLSVGGVLVIDSSENAFFTQLNVTSTVTFGSSGQLTVDGSGNVTSSGGFSSTDYVDSVAYYVSGSPIIDSSKNATFASVTDTGLTASSIVFTDGSSKLVSGTVANQVASGIVTVVASGRFTAQTAAKTTVVAYTVGGADASYEVSANILVTASTLNSFTCTVTYTDESNTSRTLTLNFSQLSGTFITTITNALGAAPYEGVPVAIRCKAGTTITIGTVGTFTTVTYNVEGIIKQTK